jgi:glycerophosphoryl diester phosphodiesterase
MKFMCIAHRGFSGQYPENTLPAFQAALDGNFGWIELDIRATADGDIVVIHDETVDRTTDGSGDVTSLATEKIRALDAGSWKDARFSHACIPFLDEVLTLVNGRAHIAIEFKLATKHIPAVLAIIGAHDAWEWTTATAFEWETITAIRELAPQGKTGWLTSLNNIHAGEAIKRCVSAGISQLCPIATKTNGGVVARAHHAGLELRCWGLGDDRGPEMSRLIECGVDGMTTNHPDVLAQILRENVS